MSGPARALRLAAALTLAAAGIASAQVPDWSLQAQRRIWGGSAAGAAADVAEWRRLMLAGEAQLAAGDGEGARSSFEAAAGMVHAADVELGIARAHLQAGHYRQAMAMAAHAAGAHPERPAAAAFYGWLLHVGGQDRVAAHRVREALDHARDDAALRATEAALRADAALPPPELMPPPLHAAPYAWRQDSSPLAAVVGSATLVDDGRAAVAPLAPLDGARFVWLRNGLGETVAATVARTDAGHGLALLRLDGRLPMPDGLLASARAPFAGSPGYLVEFAPSSDAAAAWPVMRQGFFARGADDEATRPLGIGAPPGPRGGPVFDVGGHVAGIALNVPGAGERYLPAEWLDAEFGLRVAPAAAPGPRTVAPTDAVYESALRVALQLIVER